MSESNLYKQFKNNWKPLYIKRIETSLLGNGFPDCHLVNENERDVFVELKFLPKDFKNKKLPVRLTQIHWMLEYKGKYAFYLFKIGKTFYLFNKSQSTLFLDKIKWDDFCNASMIETKSIKIIINYINCLN